LPVRPAFARAHHAVNPPLFSSDGPQNEQHDDRTNRGEGNAAQVEVVDVTPSELDANEAANHGSDQPDDDGYDDPATTADGGTGDDALGDEPGDEAKQKPREYSHAPQVTGAL